MRCRNSLGQSEKPFQTQRPVPLNTSTPGGRAVTTHIRARHRSDNDGTWQDWVAASSVARSFGRLTPYAGVKCTFLNFKYKIRQNGTVFQQGTYKDDGHVGVLFGTDYVFGRQEDVALNVESAYVNGAEITATLHYTF